MEIELKFSPEQEQVRVIVCASGPGAEVDAVLRCLSQSDAPPLLGQREGQTVPLLPEEVLRFYGENKQVLAQTAQGTYLLKLRLYELEDRLSRHTFVRISNSEIVNLRKVTALDLKLSGTIQMTLEGGTVCYVSRRNVKKLKEALGL